MNNLKKIRLCTENCEVYVIDAKFIKGINYTNSNNIFSYLENKIVHNTNQSLSIEFKNNTELELNESTIFSLNWDNRTDYTILQLVYDDEQCSSITLHWPDEYGKLLTEHPNQSWTYDEESKKFSHSFILNS